MPVGWEPHSCGFSVQSIMIESAHPTSSSGLLGTAVRALISEHTGWLQYFFQQCLNPEPSRHLQPHSTCWKQHCCDRCQHLPGVGSSSARTTAANSAVASASVRASLETNISAKIENELVAFTFGFGVFCWR